VTADGPEEGDSSIQGGGEPYTGELRYRYRLHWGRLTVSFDTASPIYSRAPANVYSLREVIIPLEEPCELVSGTKEVTEKVYLPEPQRQYFRGTGGSNDRALWKGSHPGHTSQYNG